MTSIGPPLSFMTIIGGTRWLPELETFGSKSGRVCLPGDHGWPSVAILRSASDGGQTVQRSRVIGRLKLLMNFGGPNEEGLPTPGTDWQP
jgi:hypothetical protein